jgi:hypothetical protein
MGPGTLTMGRVPFGEGDLPIERLLRDVKDTGYAGPLDLELPGPMGESEGYEPVIRRGVEKSLRDAVRTRFLRGEGAMESSNRSRCCPPRRQPSCAGRGRCRRSPYYDPDWWELERKAIFLRTWLHVGTSARFLSPAASFAVRSSLARASLLIVRGKDGEVRHVPQRLHSSRYAARRGSPGQARAVFLPLSHVDLRRRRAAALRPGLRALLRRQGGLRAQAVCAPKFWPG